MTEPLKKLLTERATPFSWRRIWLAVVLAGVVFGSLFAGLIAYANSYVDRVLPGVRVSEIPVGGMKAAELEEFLQAMNDQLVSAGLRFSFDRDGAVDQLLLYPVLVTEGSAIELVSIDVDQEVAALIAYGKDGDAVTRAARVVSARLIKPRLALQSVKVDQERVISQLKERLAPYERASRTATVEVTSVSPLVYQVVSSTTGIVFQYDQVSEQLRAAWASLVRPEIKIEQRLVMPSIRDEDVLSILPRLPSVFDEGGLVLSYQEPHTRRTREWAVSTGQIAGWLNAQRLVDNGFGFGLEATAVQRYLEREVGPVVKVAARDAKFRVDEIGKVVEFQGSRPGIEFNAASTYESLNQAILQRIEHDEGVAKTIPVSVKTVEPNVTTGEANNLGITEVLGVGHSNFIGSPANRIKNIRNAVNKLNGVLIKPGEEFSALKYTGPFTDEGGYLPELVIKGDELKPEIGGGLCQIGTTLFRMAMNSGMPITRRRNHSLVVSYYNDLGNGLPGTDATIYEPEPDFRFKNDTGNYVLVQTEMNTTKGDLFFTLWGASDGRKGSYSAPAVQRWIEPGETQYIESTTIPVGKEKCQKAFRGATAEFTYQRALPDGTKEDRVFKSYYRPLPKICLVGVKEKTQCQELSDGSGSCGGAVSTDSASGTPIIVE